MHELKRSLMIGPFPEKDGWKYIYRGFNRLAPVGSLLRKSICSYFWPKRIERAGRGAVYRFGGIAFLGKFIPTGGVTIRRLTGWSMRPYTLDGTSVGSTARFFYKTCAFEAAHLPFFLFLAAWSLRQMTLGRIDLAAEDMIINIAVNLIPMLHHRHTRVRIVALLARRRKCDAGRETNYKNQAES